MVAGAGRPWWSVHPRGCGERDGDQTAVNINIGSSPRVRGTDFSDLLSKAVFRFIPAGAGNGPPSRSAPMVYAVHPRGCGERARVIACTVALCGSSPRVRGTVTTAEYLIQQARFIPAGAGNGWWCRTLSVAFTVHPRGCGERDGKGGTEPRLTGSSPRVRGTGQCTGCLLFTYRFIPAGAGNGLVAGAGRPWWSVHPRGCGERY